MTRQKSQRIARKIKTCYRGKRHTCKRKVNSPGSKSKHDETIKLPFNFNRNPILKLPDKIKRISPKITDLKQASRPRHVITYKLRNHPVTPSSRKRTKTEDTKTMKWSRCLQNDSFNRLADFLSRHPEEQ